jgi:hypothetical protein
VLNNLSLKGKELIVKRKPARVMEVAILCLFWDMQMSNILKMAGFEVVNQYLALVFWMYLFCGSIIASSYKEFVSTGAREVIPGWFKGFMVVPLWPLILKEYQTDLLEANSR